MSERSALPAWQALQSHADEFSSTHLRNLFQADPARFDAAAWAAWSPGTNKRCSCRA